MYTFCACFSLMLNYIDYVNHHIIYVYCYFCLPFEFLNWGCVHGNHLFNWYEYIK